MTEMTLAAAMREIMPAMRQMGRRAYGVVYLISCRDSDSAYVGQTIAVVPYERYLRHIKEARRGTDGLLYRAMRAHGVEAFGFEVIANCDDQASLNAMETYFIRLYGTMAPYGYNLQEGGAAGLKSDELKRKMSEVHSSPETSSLHRLHALSRWADPEFRQKLDETWNIKRALAAPEREQREQKRLDDKRERRPAQIAARNAAIKRSHQDPAVRERIGAGTRGGRWINSGQLSRRLRPGDALPDGWQYGRGSTYVR
jgi:group I intron endonuclease